jgi:ribonucleoside-triphosphate reductase
MRAYIQGLQEQTGHVYNLEAPRRRAPATAWPRRTRSASPISSPPAKRPLLPNSTQLPVNYTDDFFETLDLQDELQSLYTGGTVLHLYLARISRTSALQAADPEGVHQLQAAYISITPTFSICNTHGTSRASTSSAPHAARPPRYGAAWWAPAPGAELQHRQA